MKGLIREEVKRMTGQNISLKQMCLIILSFLMIFSSTLTSNAAVSRGSEISPCYVNISNYSVGLSISGIRAECKATVKSNKSVALKIKMELQKEKSGGYETVKTWTSSKTGTIDLLFQGAGIFAPVP